MPSVSNVPTAPESINDHELTQKHHTFFIFASLISKFSYFSFFEFSEEFTYYKSKQETQYSEDYPLVLFIIWSYFGKLYCILFFGLPVLF